MQTNYYILLVHTKGFPVKYITVSTSLKWNHSNHDRISLLINMNKFSSAGFSSRTWCYLISLHWTVSHFAHPIIVRFTITLWKSVNRWCTLHRWMQKYLQKHPPPAADWIREHIRCMLMFVACTHALLVNIHHFPPNSCVLLLHIKLKGARLVFEIQ